MRVTIAAAVTILAAAVAVAWATQRRRYPLAAPGPYPLSAVPPPWAD